MTSLQSMAILMLNNEIILLHLRCLIKDFEVRPTSTELLSLPFIKRVPHNTRPVSVRALY